VEELAAFEAHCAELRRTQPLIADASVDVIVSNCVLNLVDPAHKAALFRDMHRVLRVGGRAVISDIVCDEEPTPAMQADSKLWSGCISGAYREDRFLAAFAEAGFYGIEILERAEAPWQTVEGIEFRSLTVRAYKGKEGPCLERHQAVVYRGPWRQVRDDDGHLYQRGQRMAVCDKTFRLLTNPSGPYAGQMLPITPLAEVPLAEAKPFACQGAALRHPRQTKGQDYRETLPPAEGACCATGECC
jgi:arsenite methyltransferase